MKVSVAAVQDSPVFFDKEQTFNKVETLVTKCAGMNCQLVVFPESFIPGYPRGFSFGTVIGSRTEEGRQLYAAYNRNSVDIRGDDLKRIENLSRKYGTYIILGVTEKSSMHGSLYCSMLYVSPKTGFLGVHRKIKPTAAERIIWAEASGEDLVSFQTQIGRIGGLICWVNYMPLARMSMYRQGVEIYVAPTADGRENWIPTMKHIALEGRCFVIGCNQYITKKNYPQEYLSLIDNEPKVLSRGGSVIVSPSGEILAGPLYDQAGILNCEIDLEEIILSKLDFDVAGHYARDDIFQLKVIGEPEMKTE